MQLGYKDKAWSVNTLSGVARHHGCHEACNRLINTLYGFNAMEVQEAFAKIRQQVAPLSNLIKNKVELKLTYFIAFYKS